MAFGGLGGLGGFRGFRVQGFGMGLAVGAGVSAGIRGLGLRVVGLLGWLERGFGGSWREL